MASRIVIVGSYGPSLVNFRGPLIAALVSAGYFVTAIAPKIDTKTASELRQIGADYIEISLDRAGMNPFRDLKYYAELRRLFGSLRPDIVLAYTIKPVIWAAFAAKASKVPRFVALITGLGFAFTHGEGRSVRRAIARIVSSVLYRLSLSRADAVVFQNPDDQDAFVSAGIMRSSEKARIINGSGVDLDLFAWAPLPSKPAFLMIARLLIAKGVREYAAAALALKSKWPSATFKLAGYFDGDHDSITKAELDDWIAQGLDYLGPLDDVRPALREASVFVLPSWREGMPRTVLEAMAMGRAIITTDVPGCRETVTPGVNGFLVPPRDAIELASAMEEFLIRPQLLQPMGKASLAIAAEKFGAAEVAADFIEILAPRLRIPTIDSMA